MKNNPRIDKKLADWEVAFNSIPNKQTQEAQILKSLILGYKTNPRKMEVFEVAS